MDRIGRIYYASLAYQGISLHAFLVAYLENIQLIIIHTEHLMGRQLGDIM